MVFETRSMNKNIQSDCPPHQALEVAKAEKAGRKGGVAAQPTPILASTTNLARSDRKTLPGSVGVVGMPSGVASGSAVGSISGEASRQIWARSHDAAPAGSSEDGGAGPSGIRYGEEEEEEEEEGPIDVEDESVMNAIIKGKKWGKRRRPATQQREAGRLKEGQSSLDQVSVKGLPACYFYPKVLFLT